MGIPIAVVIILIIIFLATSSARRSSTSVTAPGTEPHIDTSDINLENTCNCGAIIIPANTHCPVCGCKIIGPATAKVEPDTITHEESMHIMNQTFYSVLTTLINFKPDNDKFILRFYGAARALAIYARSNGFQFTKGVVLPRDLYIKQVTGAFDDLGQDEATETIEYFLKHDLNDKTESNAEGLINIIDQHIKEHPVP